MAMKLGIHSAFWGRWELAQIFLDHCSTLALEGVEIVFAGAYSYDGNDWKGALDAHGWRSVDVPNRPLGRKLNAALALLDDCDAVMHLGSDDFISRGWFRYACRGIERTQMLGTSSGYFYSPVVNRLIYLKGARMGAGRVYRADILKAVKWSLWNPGLDKSLDRSATERLGWAIPGWEDHETVEDMRAKNAMLVDVKIGDPTQKNDNIWSFHEVLGHHGDNYDCDPGLLDRYLGKETAERIRACD